MVALKNRSAFLFSVETGSPKSSCQNGHTSSEGSRGGSILSSSGFWGLQVLLGLWHPLPLSLRGLFLSDCAVSFWSLVKKVVIRFRSYWVIQDKIISRSFTLITSCKDFLKKGHISDEWRKKMWSTHTVEYYSAIKRMKQCHLQQCGCNWRLS